MTSKSESFHWVDYVIFAAMLFISTGVGVYYACIGSKQQSKEEFLLGNRKMKWLPVALSLLVSYNSGIVQLGVPAEIYLHGIRFSLSVIGTSVAALVATVTFVPLLYNLKLISSYEYLEKRFNSKGVRQTGTGIILISQIIYIGIATFTPAIALEAVTGFPLWASILCVSFVATCYTTMGGMKAVVWTDAFQAFIMIGGMLAIIISGTVHIGGWHNVWNINKMNQRVNFWNFNPSLTVRMSFWSLTLGRAFSWLPWYAVNQTSVQRYCSVSTLRKAQMIVLVNLPCQFCMDVSAYCIGLVVFGYFAQCDPLKHPDVTQRLDNPNQIVPLFVMKVMNWPGVPGLFLSSIFSGSLSTVSSCLNAMAAVTWEDLLKWKFDYLSEKAKTNILKLLVVVFGVCGIITAFMASHIQETILQVSISFMSSSFSPIMGLFILGAFFTRSNWLGAIFGGCLGLMLPMWMSIGSYLAVPGTPALNTSIAECVWNTTITNTTTAAPVIQETVEGFNKLYTVSFMWTPLIGILTTVIVGLIASLLAAPFIECVSPDKIKDCYLIFPLDRCPWKRRRIKSEDADALQHDELKEFTT